MNDATQQAVKSYIEFKRPGHDVTEVADVNIDVVHYGGSGCGSCGYDCDITTTFDISYYRKMDEAQTRPSYGRVDDVCDLISYDVDSDEFVEFIDHLASFTPDA